MDPFLTNRELASLILLGALTVLVLSQGGRGQILRSARDVLMALVSPRLLVPTLAYIGILVGALLPASHIWLWETGLWKETAVWMLISGLGLFFSLNQAMEEPGFFRRAVIRMLFVVVIVEFIANLETFPLWAELPAQGAAFFAGFMTVHENPTIRRSGTTYLGLLTLSAVAWGIWHIASDWSHLDHELLVKAFLLPIWLTPIALSVVYVTAVWSLYGVIFRLMRYAQEDKSLVAQRLALVLRTGASLSRLRMARGREPLIAGASGFWDAGVAVGQIWQERRDEAEAGAAAGRRLIENAGLEGVDEYGRQLDRREHSETMQALHFLATAQMGHYRNRGGVYPDNLLPSVEPSFERYGLTEPFGITMYVAADGQSWYAERQTVTGHWFAIGAAAPPPDQWMFDGPRRPSGFPAEPEWDQWGVGDSSVNWD